MSGDEKVNLHEHIEKIVAKKFRFDTWTNICNTQIGICKHTSKRYKNLMREPSYQRLKSLVDWTIKKGIADEVVLKYQPIIEDYVDGINNRRKNESGYNRKYYLKYKEQKAIQKYDYWEAVNKFRAQQVETHGRNHPFFIMSHNPAQNSKIRERLNNE